MKNTEKIEKQKKMFIGKGSILYSFILLSLCVIPIVEAQTPQKNLEKYWFYRQRLQEHFIYHTDNPTDPGTNQPAEGIKIFQTSEGIKTNADWGDGVWWLGHYIGMLATEYKLLKDNNQPYETTSRDLRNALRAFKRLDQNAEPYFGGESSINGFYLRDDVPNDSLVRGQLQIDVVTSSYTENQGKALGNSPSHDQAWSMSVGLALVQKCVDDDEIVRMSQEIAFLLVTGMQISKGNGSSAKCKWGIINPVNGLNVSKKKGQNIAAMRFAWGTVGTKLSGEDLHCAGSQNRISKMIWDMMQDNLFLEFSSIGLKQRVFNWYGISCLSTVINEWGNESSFNNLYDWLVYQGNKAASRRPEIGFDEFFIHLPVIAEILHGYNGNRRIDPEKYEYYLNTAPSDGGHQYYLDGKRYQSEKPWHSLSLFCPNHLDFYGEYNMIDYMLLHNAYFLAYHHHKRANDSVSVIYKEDANINTVASQISISNTMSGQSDFCSEANRTTRLYPEFNSFFIPLDTSYRVYYHKTNIEPYIVPWGDFEQRKTFIDTTTKTSSKINTISKIEVYLNSIDESIRIFQASNYQYIVSDKNGKIILKGRINDENNALLDISMFQPGFYFLNIYSANYLAGTFRINKEDVNN